MWPTQLESQGMQGIRQVLCIWTDSRIISHPVPGLHSWQVFHLPNSWPEDHSLSCLVRGRLLPLINRSKSEPICTAASPPHALTHGVQTPVPAKVCWHELPHASAAETAPERCSVKAHFLLPVGKHRRDALRALLGLTKPMLVRVGIFPARFLPHEAFITWCLLYQPGDRNKTLTFWF